jgi:hypothetical protein
MVHTRDHDSLIFDAITLDAMHNFEIAFAAVKRRTARVVVIHRSTVQTP